MSYYAALVSLVQLLKDISDPNHRLSNFLLDKQQISSLYEKFNLLRTLLEDYSPRDQDESADYLKRRIRVVAYQTQDIIEHHISNRIPPEIETLGVGMVFRRLIYAFKKIMPRQLKELEKAKEEVNCILEEVTQKISHITNDSQNYYSADSAGASEQAQSGRNTTVGFDGHLTTIKGQLRGESSKREVISIVGMGGIGKTTLARSIFYDKLIEDRFDCRVWVTISQNYHMRNILLAIINSLNISKEELLVAREQKLKEHIYKYLKGRRYLIIMDDMWDVKVWDDLKWILPDDSNGSRILITTRLSNVAVYANNSAFIHPVQLLNEDDSWNLFREKVFCPPEVEDVGRLIAKNCRGLPLAIVVVAGLLSKVNKTRHDWQEIAKNVGSSVLDQNDEHFSKILSLSYNHLPHHLKPCFLYFGGFPEDCQICASKLIRIWVAEGILKPIEPKSLEEVGEEYLEDLDNRNLVLVTNKKTNGKIKHCSIHDLLRDLCTKRASHENFLYIQNEEDDFCLEATTHVRRMYIHGRSSSTRPGYPYQLQGESDSYIRSILYFFPPGMSYPSFSSGFKLLRVLDAQKVIFSSFPDEILVLFHLRYLSLRLGKAALPSSISKLHNLQTLNVVFPRQYTLGLDGMALSSQIWKMPHLRHVMISEIDLGEFPFLGNLQTLARALNFRFTTNNLRMIPSLKTLKIFYTYGFEKKWHEFCLDNLVLLDKLQTLDIWFSLPEGQSLPTRLAFPENLKKLSLNGCRLPWKDITVVGSLPNLQVLKLRQNSYVGEEWKPIEGEFPRLKFLLLEELLDFKYWRAESTHFPCLEHLQIKYCWKLEEIPLEIGEIPTLGLIEVYGNELAADSALKIQEEQQDLGNEVLQVRIYHY